MKRNRAIWVALGVVVAASLLMFLVVVPQMRSDKSAKDAVAETTQQVKPGDDAAKSAQKTIGTQDVASSKVEPQKSAAGTEIASADSLPAFDILRVEPDGSTVIAGRAAPGADVAISDGDKVISMVKAGDSGNFAAVLDQPLPAGDHQLVLEATGKDGKKATSAEIATVSVPKDKAGELLAMVTRPGEASRIITMPVSGEKQPEAKSVEAASADTALPELPSASSDLVTTAPVVTSEATKPAISIETVETPDATKTVDANPEVQVSAVEIEGDKIFVAGKAPVRSIVRVYANDKLIATVKADEKGRFVADNTLPLAVGNHTIRADVLSADGARVEFRASVPFFRPEGEQLAAVAGEPATQKPMQPFADGAYDKAREEANKAIGLLKGVFENGKTPSAEELAAARSATEIALKTLSDIKLPSDADALAKDMAAKTTVDAGTALALLKSLPKDAASVKSALDKIDDAVTTAVEPSLKVASEQSGNAGSEDATPVQKSNAKDATTKPGQGAQSGDSSQLNGADDTGAATAEGNSNASPTSQTADAMSQAPKLIEQAPLQHSASSVIIRRGDTLWQISRRVYGKGVRYTTIYLANKDNISNPDRILPGQVFGVPDKALDNSEELHRKRLGL